MEKQLTALVVDDEEKAVLLLNKLLEDTKQFSEIRHAYSPSEASRTLSTYQPDLIFLDIKMPGKDGFTLIRELREKRKTSSVIFVTAFDQYALQAIRNHAIGYLLKPVNRQELSDCIQYYRTNSFNSQFLDRLDSFLHELEGESKIRINTRAGYFFVACSEIIYCRADGNYSEIVTMEKLHTCSLQLVKVHELLPRNGFVRLGRSLIVNARYISKVDRKSNTLTFENKGNMMSIEVSRTQIRELDSLTQ